MRYKFILSLLLFSLVFNNVSASENSTLYYLSRGIKKPSPTSEPNSLNWKIINYNQSYHRVEDECASSNDFYPLFDRDSQKEQFELSVHLERDESSESKRIVLNVTISNVTFRELKVVQQELVTSQDKAVLKIYDRIQFEPDEKPQKLTILLLVTDFHRTRLQFFADEIHNGFFKEYHFTPPSVITAENINRIEEDGIFSYVDTTFPDKVWLYVKPLPGKWNITTYVGIFRKQKLPGPDIRYSFNITGKHLQYITSNFTDDGFYDFRLTPVDDKGRMYASTNVSAFCKNVQRSVVVMIVSITAVPFVMCFALYLAYIKYRDSFQKWLAVRQPCCLVVYDATSRSHIDFVRKLVDYLNKCQITAIDLWNVPSKTHPNPGSWCDDGFQSANFVVIIPSPESTDTISAYKHLFERAMKLIDENRHCRDKNYLTVIPPYCDKRRLTEQASKLSKLELKKDKDVKKLINAIHNAEWTKEFKLPDTQELLNSSELPEKNTSCFESTKPFTDYSLPSSDEVLINLTDDNNEDVRTPPGCVTPDEKYPYDIRKLNTMGSSMVRKDPKKNPETLIV